MHPLLGSAFIFPKHHVCIATLERSFWKYGLPTFQANKNKMIHFDIPLPAHAPKGSRTHINVQLDGTQLFLLVTDFLSTCANIKKKRSGQMCTRKWSLPINKLTSSAWSPLFKKQKTIRKCLQNAYLTTRVLRNTHKLGALEQIMFGQLVLQILPDITFCSNETTLNPETKCPKSQHVEPLVCRF